MHSLFFLQCNTTCLIGMFVWKKWQTDERAKVLHLKKSFECLGRLDKAVVWLRLPRRCSFLNWELLRRMEPTELYNMHFYLLTFIFFILLGTSSVLLSSWTTVNWIRILTTQLLLRWLSHQNSAKPTRQVLGGVRIWLQEGLDKWDTNYPVFKTEMVLSRKGIFF